MTECLHESSELVAITVVWISLFALLPPALCLLLEYLHLTGRCNRVIVRRKHVDDFTA